MDGVVDLILDYGVAVGLAVLVILAVLVLKSDTLRGQTKKGVIYLLILLGVGVAYNLLTGRSLTQIPGDIARFFGDSHVKDEPTHKYYRMPEENYGKQIDE
ncbi:MAG: hypothetical protein ABFR63_03065 [Thermodesulfobacteriota bacterium]